MPYTVQLYYVTEGKVVPVHVLKVCKGVEMEIDSFVTSALEGGEWIVLP
jgi:hypothetical protein